MAGFATMLIFLGVYGYANPDPISCYYVKGLETTATTKEAIETMAREKDITVRAGYPVDMANLFRAWFIWGFWGAIVNLIIMIMLLIMYYTRKLQLSTTNTPLIVGASLCAISGCNGLVWFIIGFFWRFGSAGHIASGDKLEQKSGVNALDKKIAMEAAAENDGYQLNGGKLMSIYFYLVFALALISIFACTALTYCFKMEEGGKSSSDKRNNKNGDTKSEESERIDDNIL